MKKNPNHKASEEAVKGPSSHSDDSVDELRRILMGPLQTQLEKMLPLLKQQKFDPENISKILPEAIMIRSSRDKQIIKAMEPITEEALRSSIKKDPRPLVELLVPVMLPAIKKAITSLIKEMIQSFNATLEQGLSMQGIKWRFEALKTNRPFGEIALIHSLEYQVEQVFLIHKETGLVLQNVAAKEAVTQDPDMVSAMLTAIQDFVRDSFSTGPDEDLENLQFGDRSVWIEQSSQAVLAAVIWGNAPVDLQNVLRETLSTIHFEQIDTLKTFNGDITPFEPTKRRLLECLVSRPKEREKNTFILWIFFGLLLFCIGYFSFLSIRNHMRWIDYQDRLHLEPGIVITEARKRSGKYYISGLRDTLAADPVEILKKTEIEVDKVKFRWELYHSSHPDFIMRRIKSILRPPETINLEMKNGILYAKGSASHQWIIDSQKLVDTIPGVLGFHNENIIDLDIEKIDIVKKDINNTYFYYDASSTIIKSSQENIRRKLIRNIREIDRLTKIFNKSVLIEIIGHTDSVGDDETNLEISRNRANELYSFLISGGIRPSILTSKGVGSSEPLREELSEADRGFNRCVSFNVTIYQ